MTTIQTIAQEVINEFNACRYLPGHTECIETALEYYDGDNCPSEFIDWFTETYIHSAEIIYYHNALKFLADEDPSLMESLSLASEMGFTLDALNSETLASLLLQQKLSEEINGLHDVLSDYFEEKEESEAA